MGKWNTWEEYMEMQGKELHKINGYTNIQKKKMKSVREGDDMQKTGKRVRSQWSKVAGRMKDRQIFR